MKISKTLLIAGFSWMLVGLTCYDDDGNCQDFTACDLDFRPTEGRLNLEFSRPLPVRVVLFRGKTVESGTPILSWTPGDTVFTTTLAIGNYSAKAFYVTNGDTVVAIDGDNVGYNEISTCEGTCYESDDGNLDLALLKNP